MQRPRCNAASQPRRTTAPPPAEAAAIPLRRTPFGSVRFLECPSCAFGQRAHLTGRGLAGDEAIAESRFTDAIRFYSHALLPDESVDVGSLILVTSAMPVLRWQPRAG